MGVAQHFNAIGVRHLYIGDDHVVESAFELPLRVLSRLYGLDLVPLSAQGNVEHLADGALVIANQNVTHALSLLCPPQPLSQLLPGVLALRPAVSRACSLPQPAGASAGRTRCPLRLAIGPKPCLRVPARSDTRWPGPARCRLR